MPASVIVAALLIIIRHPFKALAWLRAELARSHGQPNPNADRRTNTRGNHL